MISCMHDREQMCETVQSSNDVDEPLKIYWTMYNNQHRQWN